MALNNRIYKYTCSVCARSIERLADPTRPDPFRCVITAQCTGQLTLTNTRFGLRPNNTPTVVGLLDRTPRGTAVTKTPLAAALNRVDLSSFSGSNGLTLALVQRMVTATEQIYYAASGGYSHVLERTSLSASQPTRLDVTAVLFELTPAALQYSQYTYARTERVIYVQGADDSAARNVLAFDGSSNLRVYVNGVLLGGSQYDASVYGTITFTPQIDEPNLLVEVFVYKSFAQLFTDDSQAIKLSFVPLVPTDPLRASCAWGDAGGVGTYTPVYCADISALDSSKTYGLVRLTAIDEAGTQITLDPAGFFLLSQPPYAFEDKRTTAVVNVASLTAEGFPLGFAVNGETGAYGAVIDGATLTPLLRPLTYTVLDNQASAQASSTVSFIVSRNEKAFILGPA